jgi:hypothetical protein
MRLPETPPGARRLRAYAELESYLADFAEGRYRFLWIVGRPGAGKTESLKAAIRRRPVYYRKGGQLTPLQFYIDCYQHRGQPIVLDDAEHLLDNTLGKKHISSLAESSPVRQMNWGTTSPKLGDTPQTYFTTSSLCIIANRTTSDEAIQSRAVILFFDPTNAEVHRAVARWFWDQEIHDWFGRHLCRLPPLDTRWYVTADLDKRAGRDWRRIVLDAHADERNRPAWIVQDLETDQAIPTREDKARAYTRTMTAADLKGASRAAYFRLRSRLEDEGRLIVYAVPPIPLGHRRPPATPSIAELDAIEGGAGPEAVPDEPIVLDVPARQVFAEPIRGAVLPAPPPRPLVIDDALPWERRPEPDGEEDDEEEDER